MFPLMQVEVVQQSLFHFPCHPLTLSTNSIKQSPWEANYHWVISFPIFIEPEGSLLNQWNPLHTLAPYFLKNYFIIILPYMPRSPKWTLPFWFADQNLNAFLITLMFLAHGEEYTLQYIILFIKKTTTEHNPLSRILSSYK
jgi:hypothetical protein